MEEKEVLAVCDVSTGTDYLDWDLSNIDTTDIPILHNPVDLYLECQDDECYTVPPVQQSYIGPSLIGQNVHLRISFPETSISSLKEVDSKIYCLNCGKFFQTDKKLKDHMKEVHKIEKPYQCTFCQFKTTCLKLLNRHTKRCLKKQNHHQRDQGENSHCNSSISSFVVFDNNSTQQLDGKDNLDSSANIGVEKSMTSRNVGFNDSKLKTLNTECQDSNSTKRISDNDIQTQQNDAHTSNSEGSVSSRITSTDFHTNSEINKIFQCNKCTFRTKTTKLLKCHIETKHNVERSLLSCNSCSFQCKQQRTMKIHVASSHSERVFKVKCDVCDKEFISIEKLKRHQLTHTNTRPFQCAKCSKTFKQLSNLSDHVKYSHLKTQIKANKKTLQCSWEGCDRLFRDKHNLNKHYKTHINASYKCNLCVFQCVYEKVLQKHKEKYHMK